MLALAALVFGAGVIGSIAAVAGVFRLVAPPILLVAIAAGAVLAWGAAGRRIAWRGDRWDVASLMLAVVAAAMAGILQHEDFVGTFDTVFYQEDAYIIANTGGRVLPGPNGPELPGFHEVPGGASANPIFGYAGFAAFFGFLGGSLEAIRWANAPLVLLAQVAMYRCGRMLGARSGALLGQAFYATCILTLWFNRWTMTENAATATFWVATLLVVRLIIKNSTIDWSVLALALAWGALVRPEGVVVAAWLLVLVPAWKWPAIRSWLATPAANSYWMKLKRPQTLAAAIIAVGSTIWLVAAILRDRSNQVVFVAQQARRLLSGRPLADSRDIPTTGVGPNWGDYALRYQWDSAMEYWLPIFLGVGVIGVATGIVGRRRVALQIGSACAVYLMFVIMPPVTIYHPWFMRKLWIAFAPLAFILAGAALDPLNAGLRWPMRLGQSSAPRLRPAPAILAGLVGLVLIGANVDASYPLAFEHEDDGIREMAASVSAAMPPDSLLILDATVAQYAPAFVLLERRDVSVWFPLPYEGLLGSIERSAGFQNVFLLRAPPQAGKPSIDSGPGGVSSVQTLDYEWRLAPRDGIPAPDGRIINFRVEMQRPPIELGYSMYSYYLDLIPPTPPLLEGSGQLELVKLVQPLTLQRRVEFVPADWSRSEGGLTASAEGGRIIPIESYSVSNITRPLALFLVHPQRLVGQWNVSAVGYDGTNTLLGVVDSDGSGATEQLVLDLAPMTPVSHFLVEAGAELSGIYVGLTPKAFGPGQRGG